MQPPQAECPAPGKANSAETVESEKHEALCKPEKHPQDKDNTDAGPEKHPQVKDSADVDGAAGAQKPGVQALPPAQDGGNLECPPPEASSSPSEPACGASSKVETTETCSRPQELPQPPRMQQPDLDFYCVKWIPWKGERTPIITQSSNGPCPLLAIMNILFLQWKVGAECGGAGKRGVQRCAFPRCWVYSLQARAIQRPL